MQVYQLSIGAACELSWPSDRIIIQILDDSTDPTIKVYMLFKKKIKVYMLQNQFVSLLSNQGI